MSRAWPVQAVVALTMGLLCAGSATADKPDLARWTHVAPVELDAAPAKGVVELSLPPQVFAKARADLADLRLVTDGGAVTPYVLRIDRGKPGRSVSYPARMFNPVYLPGKQSCITADFGRRDKRTRIDVDTPGTNFRRRVMIEASHDGQSWQVLRKTGWLFRIQYPRGSYSKNQVSLPDNDFQYLRATVFNAPDDPEKVTIREVRAWYVKSTPPETVPAETRSVKVTQKPKKKATEVSVDFGHENLPLHEIELSFEDVNFLRRVEVLGRNRRTRTITESVEDAPPRKRQVEVPWQSITDGTIHRFSSVKGKTESANLSLPVPGQVRYLLVRIHNRDNAPLKFAGLKARRLQYYLSFQPGGSGGHRLYLGNAAATKPQYDLAHFINRLRSDGVKKIGLGQVAANPLFAEKVEAVPWSERYKLPLWAALIVVLAILTGLVVRQARRIRPVA